MVANGRFYLSSQHSGIGRSFITISLHFHSSCDSGNGFPVNLGIHECLKIIKVCVTKSLPSGDICDVNESIVEGREDVSNTENGFSFTNLGSESNDSLFFLYLSFTWGHFVTCTVVHLTVKKQLELYMSSLDSGSVHADFWRKQSIFGNDQFFYNNVKMVLTTC